MPVAILETEASGMAVRSWRWPASASRRACFPGAGPERACTGGRARGWRCGGAVRVLVLAGFVSRRGGTGHWARTQRRNPAIVDAGAMASRNSHKMERPMIAIGVGSSVFVWAACLARAIVCDRTTLMRESDASA